MTAPYQPDRTLSYPDRWQDAITRQAELGVYVPNGPTGIAPGSGIVGTDLPDGSVAVHYEGWVHGAFQYADRDAQGRWEAAVRHAAGRALTGYPTVARAVLPADALVRVGTYRADGDQVALADPDTTAAWSALIA